MEEKMKRGGSKKWDGSDGGREDKGKGGKLKVGRVRVKVRCEEGNEKER